MVVSVVVEGGAHFSCVKVLPDILKATGTHTICARSHSPMLPDVAQRAKDGKRASIEIDAYIISSILSFLCHQRQNKRLNHRQQQSIRSRPNPLFRNRFH